MGTDTDGGFPEYAFGVKGEHGRTAKFTVTFLEDCIVRIRVSDDTNGTVDYHRRWTGSEWSEILTKVDTQKGGAFEYRAED